MSETTPYGTAGIPDNIPPPSDYTHGLPPYRVTEITESRSRRDSGYTNRTTIRIEPAEIGSKPPDHSSV